jgi:transcriptional regulator with XRE-family HTH domain
MTAMTPLGIALTAAMGDAPVGAVARRAGIPPSTLYAYRSGRRTPPRESLDAILSAIEADEDMRRRVYAAGEFVPAEDLPALAADIVRGLRDQRAREMAVELLRVQARFNKPPRQKGPQDAATMKSAAQAEVAALDAHLDAEIDELQAAKSRPRDARRMS